MPTDRSSRSRQNTVGDAAPEPATAAALEFVANIVNYLMPGFLKSANRLSNDFGSGGFTRWWLKPASEVRRRSSS
jgi:hypothetical protein